MSDNELLLAMSDMLDKKLKPIQDDIYELKGDVQGLKGRMDILEDKVTDTRLYMENVIEREIQMLAENYVPAAKKYEKDSAKIEAMQADIELLKKVVKDHSEKLQKLA